MYEDKLSKIKEEPKKYGGHIPTVHENCTSSHCTICDGGLFLCTVCGCAEGGLASECPGERVSADAQDEIYAGKIDFKDGKWVESSSIHSPASYRHLNKENQ